jgi:hypothetical protein
MHGRARSAQTYKEPEEAKLIVLAVLSLLGAAGSLLVPGRVLVAPVLLGGALLALTGAGRPRGPFGAPARSADEPQRMA